MTIRRSRTVGCSLAKNALQQPRKIFISLVTWAIGRNCPLWVSVLLAQPRLWFDCLHICTSCSQRHNNAQSTFANTDYVYGMENWKVPLRPVSRNFLVSVSLVSCKKTIQIYFQNDWVETNTYMIRFLQKEVSSDYAFIQCSRILQQVCQDIFYDVFIPMDDFNEIVHVSWSKIWFSAKKIELKLWISF